MIEFTPGTYRHYKGSLYEAHHLGIDEATDEPVVIYQPLYDCPDLEASYGMRPHFVRKLNIFFEQVEVDGRQVPRFELVKEVGRADD